MFYLFPHDMVTRDGRDSSFRSMLEYPVGTPHRLDCLMALGGLRSTCQVRQAPPSLIEGATGLWEDGFVSVSSAPYYASVKPCYPVAQVSVHVTVKNSDAYMEFKLAFHELVKCFKHGCIRSLTHENVLLRLSKLEMLALDECMAHEQSFLAYNQQV